MHNKSPCMCFWLLFFYDLLRMRIKSTFFLKKKWRPVVARVVVIKVWFHPLLNAVGAHETVQCGKSFRTTNLRKKELFKYRMLLGPVVMLSLLENFFTRSDHKHRIATLAVRTLQSPHTAENIECVVSTILITQRVGNTAKQSLCYPHR